MHRLFRAGLLVALSTGAIAQGRPVSVLTVAIEVARRDHPKLDEAKVRAEIDRLAQQYRELIEGLTDAPARADAFRRLLFEKNRFKSVSRLDAAKHLHIDTVLANRKGYCLSLSVVALAVAERVGMPLYGVAMPNHFLVRYDDGHFVRYLELTRDGAEVKDKDLRAQLGRLAEDSIYLRNLETRDLRAYLLHNRGYVALQRGRRASARADFVAAIKLQPGFGEAHRNHGVVLGELKQWGPAKSALIKAVAVNPRDVDALINLAICRHELGETKAALTELEMALAIDPKRERATRVDKTIDFDWQNGAPHSEAPRDRFSVRWEGYFKAPRSGTYTFFLVANDGVRLTVGKDKLIDNWRNMGFKNFYGHKEVRLAAGWHPIRIEHYDMMGGARVLLRIGVEGRKLPLDHEKHLFHTAPPNK